LITFIQDSNPNCQDKALKALEIWLKKKKKIDLDIAELIKVLIEKCISPGK